MRREHNDRPWLHLVCDFPANVLEDRIDLMVLVVHDIGLEQRYIVSIGVFGSTGRSAARTPPWLKKYTGGRVAIVEFRAAGEALAVKFDSTGR